MWARVRSLWRALRYRASFEHGMNEELNFHLDARAADLVNGGLTPAEAARQARLEFGNPAAWQEQCREARGLRLFGDLRADLRYARQGLRRHPLLSATVVLTLTLGIGVSSGVFTLLSALVLRPPVDRDAASFVRLHTTYTGTRGRVGPYAQASAEEYLAFRDGLRTIRPLAGSAPFSAWLGGEDGASMRMLLVTCNFFEVYGLERAAMGRLLQPQDCSGTDPVIVLTDSAWRTRFSADPGIVGRVISIKGLAVTVVGVASRSAAALQNSRAWMPYTLRSRVTTGADPSRMIDGHYPHDRWLNLAGRLAPAATRGQAQAEALAIAAQQDRLHPGQVSAALVTDGTLIADPGARANIVPMVTLVMGALSGLVLIACANVATLLLTRADSRQQEIAIRLSLGAGRARLMRMLLTETLLLAACAGAASLYVAWTMPPLLLGWLTDGPAELSLAPDWRVFAYLGATVCAGGIVAGLAPALESMRADVLESLKGRRSMLGALGGSRLRGALIATQVALGFVLLVGATLFIVTHYRTVTREVGLETAHVLMPRVTDRTIAEKGGSPGPVAMRGTLEGLTGARHVVFASAAPVFGGSRTDVVLPDLAQLAVDAYEVSPGFFDALDIPMVRGRALDGRDLPCGIGTCAVVVSQGLARRLFPGADALGGSVRSAKGASFQIVGVARDTSVRPAGEMEPPRMYQPWVPDGRAYQALVRFDGSADRFAAGATTALRARFPGAAVDAHTLRWPIEQWVDEIGKIEALVVGLGVTAIALAVMGVFGVVSFAVSRRTHELGVRIALGARPRDIYATVTGTGLRPAGAGLAAGVALGVSTAVSFERVLRKLEFAVSPLHPAIYAGAALLFAVVMLVALAVPARRAAGVSPLTALKAE
jgi:predicted permease